MKHLVEIVAARGRLVRRWRLTPEDTRTYPVAVWALAEDEDDRRSRRVVGVDAGWDFVRSVFAPVDSGQPDDVFNPVKSTPQPAGHRLPRHRAAPRHRA